MIKTNLVNKKLFKSANIVFILTLSLFGQLLLAETTHNNAPINFIFCPSDMPQLWQQTCWFAENRPPASAGPLGSL